MRSRPGGEKRIRKEIIGDFALDYDILIRPPIFLRKNLMAVLAFHEKKRRQRLGNGADLAGVSNRNGLISNNNEHRGKSTRQSLGEVKPPKLGDEAHELVILLKSVRKKLNFRQSIEGQDEHPRKRVKRDCIQCNCYLAIWDNREGFRSNPDPIYKTSRLGVVTPMHSPGETPWASIEMNDPFRIQTNDLLVPLPNHMNQHTKGALCDKYIMEIKMIPIHSSQRWPPIPILCKSEGSLNTSTGRSAFGYSDGILVANYANLPLPPTSEAPLSVSFDREQRTYKTKYGFEVLARWDHPVRPLEQFNQAQGDPEKPENPEKSGNDVSSLWKTGDLSSLQIVTGPKPNTPKPNNRDGNTNSALKAPTPILSYHLGDSIIKRSLSHIDVFDTANVEGYCCPACNSQQFKSLKTLRFHLANNHEKYRFDLERQEKDPLSGTITAAVFKVDIAEVNRERAANHVKDERDFVWSAPDSAFNVDSFLDGDTTWVGIPPKKRKPPVQDSTSAAPTPYLFKPTSAVPPVKQISKKRHKVPRAKTRIETPLFRSISHQLAPKGESFSESDDEIDQSWLEQIHSAKLDDLSKLSGPSKAFLSRFDAHLIQENSPHSRYLSDSLVRFSRANKDFLRDPKMLSEFSIMVSELIENGWTNVQVLSGCMAIIHGKQNVANGSGRKNVRKAAMSRTVVETSNGTSEPSNLEDRMLTSTGACAVCKEFVRNNAEHLTCSNMVSPLTLKTHTRSNR